MAGWEQTEQVKQQVLWKIWTLHSYIHLRQRNTYSEEPEQVLLQNHLLANSSSNSYNWMEQESSISRKLCWVIKSSALHRESLLEGRFFYFPPLGHDISQLPKCVICWEGHLAGSSRCAHKQVVTRSCGNSVSYSASTSLITGRSFWGSQTDECSGVLLFFPKDKLQRTWKLSNRVSRNKFLKRARQ